MPRPFTSSAPDFPAFPQPCGWRNAGLACTSMRPPQHAGGRCRSYFDAATNLTIDNGNHLLLSGNHHCARLCAGHRHRGGSGWAGARASFRSSICRPAKRWQLDSATGDCRPGCSTRRAACRTPACSTICKLAPLIWAGAGKTRRRHHSPATARCISGWCSRCCSRRSISIRRRARRVLPARSCAKRCWRAARPAGR